MSTTLLLPIFAVVSIVALAGIVLYRVLFLLCNMVIFTSPDEEEATSLKADLARMSSLGIVGHASQFLALLCLVMVRIFMAIVHAAFVVAYGMLPFLVLASLLVLLHERWTDVMFLVADAFEGSLSGTLRTLVYMPLTLLDQLGSYALPCWNLFVFTFFQMPLQLLSWVLFGSGGAAHLIEAARELGAAVPPLMMAGRAYTQANFFASQANNNNNQYYCFNSSVSTEPTCIHVIGPMASLLTAQTSLDPVRRQFDFAPALVHVRHAAAHAVLSLGASCDTLALLLNITCFPLLDPALWDALDRVVNALLAIAINAPATAALRCSMQPNRLAMCTPDLVPAWNLAAQAALRLGDVFTHWADATYLLCFQRTTLDAACQSQAPFFVDGGAYFGGNTTAISTSIARHATYSLTDGLTGILAVDVARQTFQFAPNAWPFPINPTFGVATLSTGSLFGCACADNASTIQLRCAVVTVGASDSHNSSSSSWILPVVWTLPSETQLLGSCGRIRVVVQTIRWPQTRVMLGKSSSSSSSSQRLTADAAVYVIPICGDDDHLMACAPNPIFTRGICFPYCMALRLVHEGLVPLMLRGAAEWSQGVLLAMRDCAAVATTTTTTEPQLNGKKGVNTTCGLLTDVTGRLLPTTATSSTDVSENACPYAQSCTSQVADKTRLAGYSASTTLPSSADDGSVRLLLKGQPLVLGGGTVHMRAFVDDDGNSFVDFPTIVGNTVNEFTVEPNSPIGAPLLPSNDRDDAQAGVPMPPVTAYLAIPLNPGALSPQALWYATNPSYRWLHSLAVYCASDGHRAETQIMLLSEYVPIRLQRVRYLDGACFIDEMRRHVCAPDFFLRVPLERTVPRMNADEVSVGFYDLCAARTVYNLWVEGLDYYDAYNLVVAVRQGAIVDLETGGGRTVFYFLHLETMRLRPDAPWPAIAAMANLSYAECPAVRMLPDFGGIFGHSLAAVAYLFRTLTGLLFNPFAFLELLTARAEHTCPENLLQHAALEDCGMATFTSLEEAFQELYRANTAFWDCLSWGVALLLPSSSSSSSLSSSLAKFLQGLVVVGDASHIISLFAPASGALSAFDTGAQQIIEDDDGSRRRRRQLLQADEGGSGGKKKGVMGSAFSGLKKGGKGFFALTKFVGNLVMGGSFFGGADLGAVLATSSSPHPRLSGASIAAPSIAWAHFTYVAALPAVIDAMAGIRAGRPSLAPLWLHLHEAADAMDTIIDTRMRQACAGIRLMVGYDSEFARAMYYSCMATIELPSGTMNLATILFLDVPLYRCLCVTSNAQEFTPYVMEACRDLISPSRTAFWKATLQQAAESNNIDRMCAGYIDAIQSQAYATFDDWFVAADDAAVALGSFFNQMLTGDNVPCHLTSTSTSSTSAIVLTPLPMAHFQVCAKTSACRLRCTEAIALFETKRKAALHTQAQFPPDYFAAEFERPFFNRYAPAAVSSSTGETILAFASLPSNNATASCLVSCGVDARCIAVFLDVILQLRFYCVPHPSQVLATVYPTYQDTFSITEPSLLGMTRMSSVDMIWECGRLPLILLYYQSPSTNIQAVYAWRPPTATLTRIVGTDDLASQALGAPQILSALGFTETTTTTEIAACTIQTLLPVGDLTLFIAFTLQVRLWNSAGVLSNADYTLQAIVATNAAHIRFFTPCDYHAGTACLVGLDKALERAAAGTFLRNIDMPSTYLFLPSRPQSILDLSSSSTAQMMAQMVILDPIQGLRTMTTGRYPLLSFDNAGYNGNDPIGSWTHAKCFTASTLNAKKVHDANLPPIIIAPLRFWQATTRLQSAWLRELRFKYTGAGYKIDILNSQTASPTAVTVVVNCTYLSCIGCPTASLRLLCHQAQDCVLSRCVGTVIQTRNVLCGVGAVLEQTSRHAILTWRAMHMACTELGLLAARGLSGEMITHVSLRFPTDQFYTLVCACKDMFATLIGLGVSIGNFLASSLTSSSSVDTPQTGGDIGVLAGEGVLKSTSLAGFVFNLVSTATLLPTLALHRWLLCIANTSLLTPDTSITIQFGDVTMDSSWLECAHMGDGLNTIMASGAAAMQGGVQDAMSLFVQFTLTLVSGIGETVLLGMQLSFMATMDYLIGLVWSLQDILYTFNLRSCKVPDYALRYVMRCACGDTAYRIPLPQRAHGWRDAAFWCVGTLDIALSDGTVALIDNPYSLQELSAGVAGLMTYIDCISTTSDAASSCPSPVGQNQLLPRLIRQGVDPIAVWGKCKTNYAMNRWDTAAGAAFLPSSSDKEGNEYYHAEWVSFFQEKTPELVICMQDASRLHIDYTACMQLYHGAVHGYTPNAYFVYQEEEGKGVEPPDACRVFSGLRAAATKNSTLGRLMADCMLEENVGQPTRCDLNPLLRSTNRIAVAAVHGTTNASAVLPFEALLTRLHEAYADFEAHFPSEQAGINAQLFSADGDFIHEFFDCMFLGPYTRVDLMPCFQQQDEAEPLLRCPFYARDEFGGQTRNFTACFGDEVMHGDHALPFTCGSPVRRALIKYFFRQYNASALKTLSSNVSHLVRDAVERLYTNYTTSYDTCLDPITGQCVAPCTAANYNAPCLLSTAAFRIDGSRIAQFIVNVILSQLPAYYAFTYTSTLPLLSNTDAKPFQWRATPVSAKAATDLFHFAPDLPVLHTYGQQKEDAYQMTEDPATSLWSVCAALLGQPATTLPLHPTTQIPLGAPHADNITDAARRSACPFVWHRARRHVPSVSSACARTAPDLPHPPAYLRISALDLPDLSLSLPTPTSETFRLHGFLSAPLGDAAIRCVCAIDHPTDLALCVVLEETCATDANNRSSCLAEACQADRTYARARAPDVLSCLRQTNNNKQVRCPELAPDDNYWGLFPVACSDLECASASAWVGAGQSDVVFERVRLLNEGRAGVRLPNYRHVNATYHQAVHYYSQQQQQALFTPLQGCSDDVNAPLESEQGMPAAQIVTDPMLTATCARYAVEKAYATSDAAAWRRRCQSKAETTAMCAGTGAFFLPPPPTNAGGGCGDAHITLVPALAAEAHLTATGCVLVDRVARAFYDARYCAHLARRTYLERGDLLDACALPKQAFTSSPYYSMLYDTQGPLLSLSSLGEEEELPAAAAAMKFDPANSQAQDYVSHVLDYSYYSDDDASPGYHVTSPTAPEEQIAPRLFDSHYMYDPDARIAFYVHSVARNASLLYDTLGAAGICRAPNVDMPLFLANTNRICTRMASTDGDTPHLPSFVRAALPQYAEEQCAPSHADVPWDPIDAQSRSAGGIPGWQTIIAVDPQAGLTTVTQALPPLSPLPRFSEGWGERCAIAWGDTVRCTQQQQACPTGTICVNHTFCLSTAMGRPPCYQSVHCNDDQVCLADGSCAPLTLHLWNDRPWPMEFAVVAPSCDHTMRGVSPWEQLPDLLRVHGMCSHHDWVSHRSALWAKLCPRQQSELGATTTSTIGNDGLGGYLECNASATRWPWLFRAAEEEGRSLADDNTLLLQPHACDQAYMHLAGMRTCTPRYLSYSYYYASDNNNNTANNNNNEGLSSSSWWMRTYDEASDRLHIGALGNDRAIDTPLGFLGASASSNSATLRDMAASPDNVRFFRCVDRMACHNPSYTYNGRSVERLDPLTLRRNFSEDSLRRCGAIGYLLRPSTCLLDLPLFPLFAFLYFEEETQGSSSRGCHALWPPSTRLSAVSRWTSDDVLLTEGTLYCRDTPTRACAYLPRASAVLTDSNHNDAIVQIANRLNALLMTPPAGISISSSFTRQYEHINRCAAQLLHTLRETQPAMQEAYDSAAPSGLYYALRVTLYEFPVAWLHHAWLISLLALLDPSSSATRPSSSYTTSNLLLLWTDADDLCQSIDAHTPQLWRILCDDRLHPPYTFDLTRPTPDDLTAQIRTSALLHTKAELPGLFASTTAVCYTTATWRDPTLAAVAYNASACLDDERINPCLHPEHFEFADPVQVVLAQLADATRPLAYMQDIQAAALAAIDKVAIPMEYVREGVSMRIWPLAAFMTTSSSSAFNLSRWLHTEVCDVGNTCLNQYDTDPRSDPCIYPTTIPPESDRMRYWVEDQAPVVTLHYANGEKQPDHIPVCDLPLRDVCVVQHRGVLLNQDEDNNFIAPDAIVPCDITGIDAPPGIQVQGFALRISSAHWTSLLADNTYCLDEDNCPASLCTTAGNPARDSSPLLSGDQISTCTWLPNHVGTQPIISDAWWSNGTTVLDEEETSRPDLNNFGRLSFYDFGVMQPWWENTHQTEWRSYGCGNVVGLCALRIRFEYSLATGAATCVARTPGNNNHHNNQISMGALDTNSDGIPNCARAMDNSAWSPFVVAQDAEHILYRCGPCTRYKRTRASPSHFGCTLKKQEDDEVEVVRTEDDWLARIAAPQATPYLSLPDSTLAAIYQGGGGKDEWNAAFSSFLDPSNRTIPIDVKPSPAASPSPILQNLRLWRKRANEAEEAATTTTTICRACLFTGFDISAVTAEDHVIWKRAVDNPALPYTMLCQNQPYTADDALHCAAATTTRRMQLADFVQSRYREGNGVPLAIVPPGMSVSWPAPANLRSFALFYASSRRTPEQVLARWLLGDGPCAAKPTRIEDRICVESRITGNAPFVALHPWVGGDFNAFEGRDQCTTSRLCPATCVPRDACRLYNYSHEFDEGNGNVARAPAYTTLANDDVSNLCAAPISSAPRCTHPQSFLGGGPYQPVTFDQLHSRAGVDAIPLSQHTLAQLSPLWLGELAASSYGFLNLPREDMHPAHIAFHANTRFEGAPLTVASLSLGFDHVPTRTQTLDWLPTLPEQRADDATRLIAPLYPTTTTTTTTTTRDWACPLRAFAFWGAADPAFAPLAPHPPLMQRLFPTLHGAHPFIRTRSSFEALRTYRTTNGACFYLANKETPSSSTAACSLQALIRALDTSSSSSSTSSSSSAVFDDATTQCIVDTPNIDALLRSDEPLSAPQQQQPCGVLHRLTPFLMRTRGDAAPITPLVGTSIRDEGGDCHMGRALLSPSMDRDTLAGRSACALIAKNRSAAVADCGLVFARGQPLSLLQLAQKTRRYYRDQITADQVIPQFLGPAGARLAVPEVSFGLLRILPLPIATLPLATTTTTTTFSSNTTATTLTTAELRDIALWNTPNWAWSASFPSFVESATVNRTRWMRGDRYGACREGMPSSSSAPPTTTTQPIMLCEPALTPSMQRLCDAMLQFRIDVQTLHCERTDACLHDPGAFYLPYMWSPTNQEFAADTVITYYRTLFTQARFINESYDALCPERNALMQKIIDLSRIQSIQCPGYQMEYLKDLFEAFKFFGHEILYLAYCCVMFVVNALAVVLAGLGGGVSDTAAQSSLALAGKYLIDLFNGIARLILPILNAVIKALMQLTPFGRLIKETLKFFCDTYNYIIHYYYKPIWCAIIRPAIYGSLKTVEVIVRPFSSSAADQIYDVWKSFSDDGDNVGADVDHCLGSLAGELNCDAIDQIDAGDDPTAFAASPVATRCWSDGVNRLYASYLSCTASDTCAVEPLAYDSGLIACNTCPLDLEGAGRAFGCDMVLKRCTCGVALATTATECLTNNDCSAVPGTVCAIISNLNDVASSITLLDCVQCASIQSTPSCVYASASARLCACVPLAAALKTCDLLPGTRVTVLNDVGFCLYRDDTKEKEVADFSSMSLAPCLTASHFVCLTVYLPLAAGGGQLSRSLIVASSSSSSSTSSHRRRLLSEEQTSGDYFAEALQECMHRFHLQRAAVKHCLTWYLSLSSIRRNQRSHHANNNNNNNNTNNNNNGTRRLLLQETTTTTTTTTNAPFFAPSSSCAALNLPLTDLISAFHDTMRFYDSTANNNSMLNGYNQTPAITLLWQLVAADNDAHNAGNVVGSLRHILDVFLSLENANNLTGRRLVADLSHCNFTALTLGPPPPVPILYLVLSTVCFFAVLTPLLCPSSCFGTTLAWGVLFPIALTWLAYGLSPLCWPMLPPRLPHDLAIAVANALPTSLEMPRFLVRPDCTVRGIELATNDFNPVYCFSDCTADPFLVRSWQEPLAWWTCELSPTACQALAASTFFPVLANNAAYFADVLAFGANDPDFVAAHRLCNAFASYYLVFAFAIAATCLLALPSILTALFELGAGAVVLAVQTTPLLLPADEDAAHI